MKDSVFIYIVQHILITKQYQKPEKRLNFIQHSVEVAHGEQNNPLYFGSDPDHFFHNRIIGAPGSSSASVADLLSECPSSFV